MRVIIAFVLALTCLACAPVNKPASVSPGKLSILVVNHGQTSATVHCANRIYLGRVSGGGERCFALPSTCTVLVVDRADGTWATPYFDSLSADGWRVEIDNYSGMVYQTFCRTLLPAEPCR